MHYHDHEFEQIFNSFQQSCPLTKCMIFRRNNRRRENDKNNINYKQQILDKIHCYFKHSYDIGHHIGNKESQIINNSM